MTDQPTILIVVDDPDVVRLMRIVLEDAGHTVLSALDGDRALASCRRYGRRIDVLLADVVLPRMNGPELAERVYEAYPDLQVIFITGYPFKEVAADIAPVKHTMLLMKPVRIGMLVRDVERVMVGAGKYVR